MNRVGVIVDVAHSGWQTCIDAAKTSGKPIVASHTGCWSLHPHRRSKSDDVIKAIVDADGYIGVYSIPAFLGRTEDICAMLDHIDTIAKKFGADHVAIGTDVSYTPSRMDTERAKILSLWPKS